MGINLYEKHYNAGMWQKYDKKAEIRENLCLDCVNLRETRGAQTRRLPFCARCDTLPIDFGRESAACCENCTGEN